MSLLDQLKKQSGEAAETTGFKSSTTSNASSGGIVQSVSIPIDIQRDGGKLRIYLQVSPEAVESPDTLNAVLDMIEQNYDLAVWRKSGNSGNSFKSYRRRY